MTAYRCLYCRQPVVYASGHGWTHLGGNLVVIRRMTPAEVVWFERNRGREPGPMEMEIDDHVATPIPVERDRGRGGIDHD